MVNILYHIRHFLGRYYSIEDLCKMDPYFEWFIVKYYELFPKSGSGIRDRKANRKLIVSMTTIPSRVDKVWVTIESLLRQTYKPDQIILWLAKDEFADVKLSDRIKKQTKRGLTVRYCDNLKSYKKFYYTMKENPNAYVITVDDDIIYAETMVAELVKTYRYNPKSVICHRSHLIRKRSSKCVPYDSWIKYEDREEIRCEATYANFFTGCAGILFPTFLLDKRVLDKEGFLKYAPTADDVWLNFICWISGLKIKNTEGIMGKCIFIRDSSENGLMYQNVIRRKNDSQIKDVMEYFKINIDDYI